MPRTSNLLSLLWCLLLVGAAPGAAGGSDISKDLGNVFRDLSSVPNLSEEGAPVKMSDEVVFRVHGAGGLKASERAASVESKLRDIAERVRDTAEAPEVKVVARGSLRLLVVGDRYLLTVTDADLRGSDRESIQGLANAWQRDLQDSLDRLAHEHSEEFWQIAALEVAGVLVLAVFLSWLLHHRIKKHLSRLYYVSFMMGIWLLAAFAILGVFPATRPLQNVLQAGFLRPFVVIVALFLSGLVLQRLAAWGIDSYFRPLAAQEWSATNRALNKAMTLRKVAKTTAGSFIVVLAVLAFLVLMGVDPGSAIAGAGVFGLAASLVAQDLLKGTFKGLSILTTDQFSVGDVICVGGHCGLVEDFSLNFTKLRNLEGVQITVPNRDIAIVENLTSHYSQVDLQLGVHYNSDLRQVMQIMLDTAEQLRQEWPQEVIAPAEMLGVDSFQDSAIVVRMTVKTLPMHQWSVKRELNLRLKEAFDEAGITIPYPQREISFAAGYDPAYQSQNTS